MRNSLSHKSGRRAGIFPPLAFLAALLTLLLLVTPRIAHAQLTFTLSDPMQNAPAGSSLIFAGTLTNNGADDVFLNSITFNLFGDAVDFLSGDENVFLNNVPLSLAGNGGTYTGSIFGAKISSAAPEGGYFGLAIIKSGPNAGDEIDETTAQFQVVVVPAATSAPEPVTIGYWALGIGCWVLGRRRIRIS